MASLDAASSFGNENNTPIVVDSGNTLKDTSAIQPSAAAKETPARCIGMGDNAHFVFDTILILLKGQYI